MFDAKAAYFKAITDRNEFLRTGEKNAAVLQAYETLINVLSNDPRFRAKMYIELSSVDD